MSFEYNGKSFESAVDAALACVEAYAAAAGAGFDPGLVDYLQSRDNVQVLAGMRKRGWQLPDGVTDDEVLQAVEMFRHLSQDDEATVVSGPGFLD